MLARTYRFHGYGSLRYVYNRGQSIRTSFGVLKYASNPKRKTWRAAVVVSKKVHKSAVVRNRIRRRIYEILRTTIPKDTPAFDIVYVVYAAQVAEMQAHELQKAIVAQLQKSSINLSTHAIVDEKE
jgi:ribonuclease P protein component